MSHKLTFLFLIFSLTKCSLPTQVKAAWLLTDDSTVPMPSGWYPKIRSSYPFNTYFLSFINPNQIFSNNEPQDPPSSFTKFSLNRDSNDGPKSTDKVIYSIGGYSYSQGGYAWSMFDNDSNAIAFAQKVASWKKLYKMDGFDLDWETSSLSSTQKEAIFTFVTTLKKIDSEIIITIEEAGYPQYVVSLLVPYVKLNNKLTEFYNSVDAFNVMYYSVDLNQNSLSWANNDWEKDCTNWCPLGSSIPSEKIILGAPGCCDSQPTENLIKELLCNHGVDGKSFKGFMVWFISSDSNPKIAYQGTCQSSGGCEMNPNNSKNFEGGICYQNSFLSY